MPTKPTGAKNVPASPLWMLLKLSEKFLSIFRMRNLKGKYRQVPGVTTDVCPGSTWVTAVPRLTLRALGEGLLGSCLSADLISGQGCLVARSP